MMIMKIRTLLASSVLLVAPASAAFSHGQRHRLPETMRLRRSGTSMCAADRLPAGWSPDWRDRPFVDLSPTDVVEAQLSALQRGDEKVCYRFASPDNRQSFVTMVQQTPYYEPLFGCDRFAVVGALSMGEDAYRCRVRVWPASSHTPPLARLDDDAMPVLDYDWDLTRQPDDLMDYTMAGCWMVDRVKPDMPRP